VGVEFLAFGAKVLSAEGTAVPLSDNAKQVPVAKRERMGKVAQISRWIPRYFSSRRARCGARWIPIPAIKKASDVCRTDSSSFSYNETSMIGRSDSKGPG